MTPAESNAHRPRRHVLAVILIASFTLKLALLVPAHHTRPINDAWEYDRTARHLYQTGEYLSNRAPCASAVPIASLADRDLLRPCLLSLASASGFRWLPSTP